MKKVFEKNKGLIVPGGFGTTGVDGILEAIKYVRINKIPYLGICYGMQLAVIEFARNVLNLNEFVNSNWLLYTRILCLEYTIKKWELEQAWVIGMELIPVIPFLVIWQIELFKEQTNRDGYLHMSSSNCFKLVV